VSPLKRSSESLPPGSLLHSDSFERRIGPTQALSLIPAQGSASQPSPPPSVTVHTPGYPQHPNTISGAGARPSQDFDAGRQYTTLASTGQNGYAADEFGYSRVPIPTSQLSGVGVSHDAYTTAPGRRPGSSEGVNGNGASRISTSTSSGPNARIPPSAQFAQRRFTVTNIDENDSPNSSEEHVGALVETGKKPITPPRDQWLTAEQEKQMLYERARAQAEHTQGMAANPTVVSCYCSFAMSAFDVVPSRFLP
jgi:hypothetical protein